jgi:predicted lipoprotein
MGLVRRAALFAVLLGAATMAGCKVVTIEQDQAIRAKRSLDFDAGVYVSRIWTTQALPELQRRATPARELFPAIDANPEDAGARLGRRASEGGAWTFVVRGQGVVTAIDDSSRRGAVEIALGDGVSRAVKLETGPVVVGTTVRDALPFIAFDDFSDQLAYADVGRALTTTALARLKPVLNDVRPGDRVRFLGAFHLSAPGQPVLVTPVSIEKVASAGVAS